MIRTVGDLRKALEGFDPGTRVCFIHDGRQTFGPHIFRVERMFETREDFVSRGEIDENVSREKSDGFPDEVAVIRGGW
jgi:hypothetical protein